MAKFYVKYKYPGTQLYVTVNAETESEAKAKTKAKHPGKDVTIISVKKT